MTTPERQHTPTAAEMKAIVAAIQQALQPQGITVKAHCKAGCLRLLLEGLPVPEPEPALALVRQAMQQFQRESVSIQVYGRILGADRPTWQRSLSQSYAAPPQTQPNQPTPSSAVPPLDAPTIPTPMLHPPANRVTHQVAQAATRALRPVGITSAGWSALITGLVLAIGLVAIGFLNLLFHGFIVLVHEIGHAATHWAFGEPAIPAVNILHGGGITLSFGRSPLLIAFIYGALLFGIWRYRTYPRVQGIIVLFGVIYTLCLVTPVSQMLTVGMGHGMELIAIGVCLYLAASGYFCRFAGDRSIYAMLGFYTLFTNLKFAWNLMRHPEFREWYEGGIGGMIDNDFVILATQYFHVDLAIIAQMHLMGCVGAIVLTFLTMRYEPWGWLIVNQVIGYRSKKHL